MKARYRAAPRQRCHLCGFVVPITADGLQRMADHWNNLECRPTFDDSTTCRHRWQDTDTPSNVNAEADDTHRCIRPHNHDGQHICDCTTQGEPR